MQRICHAELRKRRSQGPDHNRLLAGDDYPADHDVVSGADIVSGRKIRKKGAGAAILIIDFYQTDAGSSAHPAYDCRIMSGSKRGENGGFLRRSRSASGIHNILFVCRSSPVVVAGEQGTVYVS